MGTPLRAVAVILNASFITAMAQFDLRPFDLITASAANHSLEILLVFSQTLTNETAATHPRPYKTANAKGLTSHTALSISWHEIPAGVTYTLTGADRRVAIAAPLVEG